MSEGYPTRYKTELTYFFIGVCLLQDPNHPFENKHPPTMHGTKKEEERSDVEGRVVIWTPGNIRV